MKRAVCTLLLCFFAVCFSIAKSGEEHDNDLHEVLFGKGYNARTSSVRTDKDYRIRFTKSDKIEKLDAACYLLLDYSGNDPENDGLPPELVNAEEMFREKEKGAKCLRKLGVFYTLEQINTPPGPDHEKYTHLGWDEKWYKHAEWYEKDPVKGEKYLQAFKIRRDGIMLESVQTKIFNDASITRRQAELFAKLCYYVHIVGDHENNSIRTAKNLMMLVQRPYEKKQRTVIDELISICTELFMFQEDTSLLVGRLRSVRDKKMIADDSEEFGKAQIRKIAENVLEILKQNVPDLLRNWEPFVENFYEKDYYQDQEDLLAS